MDRQQTGKGNELAGGSGTAPLWKRVLDVGLVLLLSPGLLILGGLVALIVKIGSSGPVLFRQPRVGYKGRIFTCYKFRSMRMNAETNSHRQHTTDLIKSQKPMVKLDASEDPRLIPGGALLRACGLDELPQLFNILRGDMSLVGPRPCIPYEWDQYEAWHRRRFDAVPGLTGLWQVSGKNRTTFDEMVHLDILYSQRQSLWLDLQIMVRTFPALWGQYSDLRAAKANTVHDRTVITTSADPRTSIQSFS
jgi:exopolysaccharide production protein ExoY